MDTPDYMKQDTFTRMSIDAGPFDGNKYLYALYFIVVPPVSKKDEEELILFSLRYCAMYPGEPRQEYAPGEYRRIYRQALPANLPEGTVQAALDEYNQRRRPIATATERFLAKPLK